MTPREFESLFEDSPTSGNRVWDVIAECLAWSLALTFMAAEIIGLIVIAGWLAGR